MAIYRKRFDAQSHVRRLAENMWDDLSEEEEVEEDEAMDVETKPRRYRKPGRYYKNQVAHAQTIDICVKSAKFSTRSKVLLVEELSHLSV